MSDFLTWFVGCLTAIIIVGTIVGGIVYTGNESSRRYYEAQRHCIDSGGTWIPAGGNGGTSCLRLKGAGE